MAFLLLWALENARYAPCRRDRSLETGLHNTRRQRTQADGRRPRQRDAVGAPRRAVRPAWRQRRRQEYAAADSWRAAPADLRHGESRRIRRVPLRILCPPVCRCGVRRWWSDPPSSRAGTVVRTEAARP